MCFRATICFTIPDDFSPKLTRVYSITFQTFSPWEGRTFFSNDHCTKGEAPETVLCPRPMTQKFTILSETLLAASVASFVPYTVRELNKIPWRYRVIQFRDVFTMQSNLSVSLWTTPATSAVFLAIYTWNRCTPSEHISVPFYSPPIPHDPTWNPGDLWRDQCALFA